MLIQLIQMDIRVANGLGADQAYHSIEPDLLGLNQGQRKPEILSPRPFFW